MESQENSNKKKSNGLVKRMLRMSPIWKTIIVALILAGAFAVGSYAVTLIGDIYHLITSDKYYVSEEMGGGYEVRTYYDGPNRIVRNGKCRAIIKDVDCVVGDEGDSLWVVYKEDKAAFFNTRTGRLAIPFIYEKAWPYSEGVAAVVDSTGMLHFVDPEGRPVFNCAFGYRERTGYDFGFHHGLCQVYDTTWKVGLINKTGCWAVEPQYDSIMYIDGYWVLTCGDSLLVVDSLGQILIGMAPGREVKVLENGNLEVWHRFRPGRLYDASGRLVARQTYRNAEVLSYYEDATEINTNTLSYSTSYGHYGLMSRDGSVLTDAIYTEVEAIDRTLFVARYQVKDDYESTIEVILNDKGELVEEKENNGKKQKL